MKSPRPEQSVAPKFHTKKSLGQNFLTSDVVPKLMADAASLVPGVMVVEVGPGTGVLTTELLARGATVYAIETDERAVTLLKETFAPAVADGQLHIISADMRTFDLSTLPLSAGQYTVVANIPYYLSGFLLRQFLEHACYPATLVFLMQKELVERIARSKKESLLSLGVKAFGHPQYVKTIARGHFRPVPKVDSAILSVTDIAHDAFSSVTDREAFFHLLHLGFGQKRKQLVHNLAPTYGRERVHAILTNLSLPLTVRAEDIPLATWQQLHYSLSA